MELHFGCHEDPEALQARLELEPALRALQAEVLRKAQMLEQAARPVQAPLALAEQVAHGKRDRCTEAQTAQVEAIEAGVGCCAQCRARQRGRGVPADQRIRVPEAGQIWSVAARPFDERPPHLPGLRDTV